MDFLPLIVLLGGSGLAIWFFVRARAGAPIAPGGPAIGDMSPPADPPTMSYDHEPPVPIAPPIYAPPPAVTGVRSVSAAGDARIKAAEGLKLTRYGDAGKRSIGYGHQIKPGENYTTIDQATAENLFMEDMAGVEATLNSTVRVPLTQNQYDALADLIYNIGATRFRTSTLLRDLNAGNVAGALQQFGVWVHSAGRVDPVLVARRRADANLFGSA